MKPMALLFICVILLFGTSLARAQAFRGSAGGGGSATMSMPSAVGGRSATAPVASGVITGQAVQGSQGFRGPSLPPTIQASPGFQNRGFSSPPRTIQSHRGGGFVPSPFIRSRPPFFILGSVPFHPHRHWFFHRHPGLVFIDVPYVLRRIAERCAHAPSRPAGAVRPNAARSGGTHARSRRSQKRRCGL